MLPAYHYMQFYHWAYGINQWLASQGYVVLSVNFRSGVGYGRSFRYAPNTGANGNAEYQDVVAGGRYLQSRPDVRLCFKGALTIQRARDEAERFFEKIWKKGDLSIEEGRNMIKEFFDEKLKTALDAVAVLTALDWSDRRVVKEGYAAAVVKRHQWRPTFDALFDLYFPRMAGEGSGGRLDESLEAFITRTLPSRGFLE